MAGLTTEVEFLTGREVHTHEVPDAMKASEPRLRSQFPELFPDSKEMQVCLEELDRSLKTAGDYDAALNKAISAWVESVRLKMNLPEMLPLLDVSAKKRKRTGR